LFAWFYAAFKFDPKIIFVDLAGIAVTCWRH